MLEFLKDEEEEDVSNASKVGDTLTIEAHSEDFLKFLHDRILKHITKDDDFNRPYIFLYGIGSIYPYLRVNDLLSMYEDYNLSNKYKVVVFYPGKSIENSFSLFGVLPDNHTYRALLLINDD